MLRQLQGKSAMSALIFLRINHRNYDKAASATSAGPQAPNYMLRISERTCGI